MYNVRGQGFVRDGITSDPSEGAQRVRESGFIIPLVISIAHHNYIRRFNIKFVFAITIFRYCELDRLYGW